MVIGTKRPTPRVYVSASMYELERAERAIAGLRLRGVEITHDWTRGADPTLDGPGAEQRHRIEAARADLFGVRSADAVLWLVGKVASFGAPFEVGFAAAFRIPVVVVGLGERSVFGAILDELHDGASDEDAVARVATIAEARAVLMRRA